MPFFLELHFDQSGSTVFVNMNRVIMISEGDECSLLSFSQRSDDYLEVRESPNKIMGQIFERLGN